MGMIWQQMGFMRWPLAFSLVLVIVLTAWSAAKLFRRGATGDLRTKAWVDSILFWGVFALITGVLGTLLGVIIAARSIAAAGHVAPMLVWGGIQVALTTATFGALILAFAAVLWFVLQLRWRLLVAEEERRAVA